MANNIFRFKQFDVDQSGCTMKINTDGVLLAAVSEHPAPRRILDIGAGTGVIALMLAQRFNQARVDAVEIDEQAAVCAAGNTSASPFASRLRIYKSDIQEYEADTGYDLIVSNPPYFVNDLRNPDPRKTMARHTNDEFVGAMLEKVSQLLNPGGRFWFVLPVKQAEKLIVQAIVHGLLPLNVIHLHSDAGKNAFRQIVCLGRRPAGSGEPHVTTAYRHLYIYESRGVYTDDYKYLLKDFFLAF